MEKVSANFDKSKFNFEFTTIDSIEARACVCDHANAEIMVVIVTHTSSRIVASSEESNTSRGGSRTCIYSSPPTNPLSSPELRIKT